MAGGGNNGTTANVAEPKQISQLAPVANAAAQLAGGYYAVDVPNPAYNPANPAGAKPFLTRRLAHADLLAVLGSGAATNALKGTTKIVEYETTAEAESAGDGSALDQLPAGVLCVGTRAVVLKPTLRGLVLAADPSGPLVVAADGHFAAGNARNARWLNEAEAFAAAEEPFNPLRAEYPLGFRVNYRAGGRLRLFQAAKALRRADFANNRIPAPTGTLGDLNWEEVSADVDAPVFHFRRVTQAYAAALAEDDGFVEAGVLYLVEFGQGRSVYVFGLDRKLFASWGWEADPTRPPTAQGAPGYGRPVAVDVATGYVEALEHEALPRADALARFADRKPLPNKLYLITDRPNGGPPVALRFGASALAYTPTGNAPAPNLLLVQDAWAIGQNGLFRYDLVTDALAAQGNSGLTQAQKDALDNANAPAAANPLATAADLAFRFGPAPALTNTASFLLVPAGPWGVLYQATGTKPIRFPVPLANAALGKTLGLYNNATVARDVQWKDDTDAGPTPGVKLTLAPQETVWLEIYFTGSLYVPRVLFTNQREYVRTVNGQAPDAAGNVAAGAGPGGATGPNYAAPTTLSAAATLAADTAYYATGGGYALTLPPAAGNVGKVIFVKIAAAATGLYPVAGGPAGLALYAGESLSLRATPDGWDRTAGQLLPLECRLETALGQQTPVPQAQGWRVPFTVTQRATLPAMVHASGQLVVVPRAGAGTVDGFLALADAVVAGSYVFYVEVTKAAGGALVYPLQAGLSPDRTGKAFGSFSFNSSFAAGDTIGLWLYTEDAARLRGQFDGSQCALTYTESV